MNPARGPRIILRPVVTRIPTSSTLNPEPTPVKLEPEENCCTCTSSNSNVSTSKPVKEEKRFICKSCPFPLELPDEQTYLRHMDLAHLFNRSVLRVQGLEEQAKITVQGHAPSNNGSEQNLGSTRLSEITSSSCKVCKAKFSTFEEFSAHVRNECPNLELPPPVIDLTNEKGRPKTVIPEKPQVKRRKIAAEEEKDLLDFSCKRCPEQPVFSSASELLSHKLKCHPCNKKIAPPPRFECPICGNSFSERGTLDKHIKARHSDLNPFACSNCGKRYSSTLGLNRHKEKPCDPGDYPFACEICLDVFKNKANLKSHKVAYHKSETETKKEAGEFKCIVCGKVYKNWGSRQIHMEMHRKVHRFVCKSCGKFFTGTAELAWHNRKPCDKSEYTFKCPICSNIFNAESALKCHMSHNHREDS